jgi:hypothetical protein
VQKCIIFSKYQRKKMIDYLIFYINDPNSIIIGIFLMFFSKKMCQKVYILINRYILNFKVQCFA